MPELPTAVERFLEGCETGDWSGMEQHFMPDAVHDGTFPGGRVRYQGPSRIVQELRESWTGSHTWDFAELHVIKTSDAVVVDLEMRGVIPADDRQPAHEECCRMANIFRLDDGRIAEHRYYCAGMSTGEVAADVEQRTAI